MKILIVFYSRTGVTRELARALAGQLQADVCDVEEIFDQQDRSGPMGYITGGRDALMKHSTMIRSPSKSPADYDTVVIGTPVWAANMAPAIRAYVTAVRQDLPAVAFFCTMGGMGDKRTFRNMSELAGKEPVAELTVRENDVRAEQFRPQLDAFISQLQAAALAAGEKR